MPVGITSTRWQQRNGGRPPGSGGKRASMAKCPCTTCSNPVPFLPHPWLLIPLPGTSHLCFALCRLFPRHCQPAPALPFTHGLGSSPLILLTPRWTPTFSPSLGPGKVLSASSLLLLVALPNAVILYQGTTAPGAASRSFRGPAGRRATPAPVGVPTR